MQGHFALPHGLSTCSLVSPSMVTKSSRNILRCRPNTCHTALKPLGWCDPMATMEACCVQ